MQRDGFMSDRIGTAFTIGFVGAAFGGSAIGGAVVGAGVVDPSMPLANGLVGLGVIAASAVAAGWYMPAASAIGRRWAEYEDLEDGESE